MARASKNNNSKSASNTASGYDPNQDPLFPSANKLQEAERLRQQKKYQRAKRKCDELLQEFPDYVGALHTLGLILADMNLYEQSATYLGKAAMLCPVDWRILTALAGVNIKLNRLDTAVANLEMAQKVSPDNIEIAATLVEVYREQKEYEKAADLLSIIIDKGVKSRDARMLLADCYEHMGNINESAEIYNENIENNENYFDSVICLLQLPDSINRFDPSELIYEINEEDVAEVYKLHFSQALAYHRQGDHEKAWSVLHKANKYKRDELIGEWIEGRGRRGDILNWSRDLKTINYPRDGDDWPVSLFVMGPSRSGKTSLEILLTCLPGLKRGYENPIVENSVRRTMQTSGCITRSGINGMPLSFNSTFLEFYRKDLEGRADGARIFTNTHPGKVTELPRYGLTIPNARFLFVKRNAEDLAIRIFMKNYASGNNYAYDIDTIIEHINWYYAMIDVCLEKMPGISAIVEYEQMVEDPRSAIQIASKLCGVGLTSVEIPPIGDDRGASRPYRQYFSNH